MKKLNKKNNSQKCCKSSNSRVFRFKKEIETVLNLTLKPFNEESFSPLNSPKKKVLSMSPIKNNINRLTNQEHINSNIKENNVNNIQYDRYRKELNRFSDSLRQLKTYFPNNTELKELEKSIGVMAPARIEHIKLENNLKDQINEIDMQEKSLRATKDILENELVNLDKKILDQQLNKEVTLELEKENNNKLMKDKLLSELEKTMYPKDKENSTNNSSNNITKLKKKTLSSSREFQEKFDLFLKREEYLTKQKEKEIEKDISNKREKKKGVMTQLNGVNESLKDLHKIKNFFLNKLYEHYLNVLKEGKDTRNEGLSWVIREIFSLDKKVMLSYMPQFLDKLCIKYIFDMTHLNIKITEIENDIKKSKQEFKKIGIINKGDEYLTNKMLIKENHQRMNINEITENYWEKIRKTFGDSYNFKKSIKNNHSILHKHKNKEINKENNTVENQRKSVRIKTDYNLPLLSGDPNLQTNTKNEIGNMNKHLKESHKQNAKIPDVLKIKDYAKLTTTSGYFLNSEEIKKIQNYLSLKSQLYNLRKKKEAMKTKEMTRIFKEFQRNDYENRFNTDKTTVISALIGEDNLNSELLKQSKREKKYIEEIMKGRMHKKMKSVDKAMMEKNLLVESLGLKGTDKMVKSMNGFEMDKNIDIAEFNKAFDISFSKKYGSTF